MGPNVISQFFVLLFSLVVLATAEVTLNGKWEENFGWELTCSWKTWFNDTLQSVRLLRDDNQFFNFRPEIHGRTYSQTSRVPESQMKIECMMVSEGQKGRCVVKLEPLRGAKEDTFKCEVSGENPTFRLESAKYTVFGCKGLPGSDHTPAGVWHQTACCVPSEEYQMLLGKLAPSSTPSPLSNQTGVKMPPSDATLKPVPGNDTSSSRRELNCTSSGIPAPKLQFSVDTQNVPEDFTHTVWNPETKLWHSWATYNPQQVNVVVSCTPVVATKSGAVERGNTALWTVTNAGCCLGVIKLILLGSLIVSFFL